MDEALLAAMFGDGGDVVFDGEGGEGLDLHALLEEMGLGGAVDGDAAFGYDDPYGDEDERTTVKLTDVKEARAAAAPARDEV